MMDIDLAQTLLGGLNARDFMRRHWQKKPLLVRQAWPGVQPPLPRARLFALAAGDDVESRLVQRDGDRWTVRHGPIPRRALPPLQHPGWTLLVQGLDLHVPAAHSLLRAFRFVPAARLDDLMVSWASPGGGVGPHLDSYDVFLLQVQGRRRWSVAPLRRSADAELIDGAPLKLLRRFVPERQWLLEPGDMLYLPPHWAHDGVAEGADCMTCSIGFRAPTAGGLARELLLRLADGLDPAGEGGQALGAGSPSGPRGLAARYRDAAQSATATPGAVPEGLLAFARDSLAAALADPRALSRTLGEWLSEPKPNVWFEGAEGSPTDRSLDRGVRLDVRTRMLYDDPHVFINGESFLAAGRDAGLMHELADDGFLAARKLSRLSAEALDRVQDWVAAGWLRPLSDSVDPTEPIGSSS